MATRFLQIGFTAAALAVHGFAHGSITIVCIGLHSIFRNSQMQAVPLFPPGWSTSALDVTTQRINLERSASINYNQSFMELMDEGKPLLWYQVTSTSPIGSSQQVQFKLTMIQNLTANSLTSYAGFRALANADGNSKGVRSESNGAGQDDSKSVTIALSKYVRLKSANFVQQGSNWIHIYRPLGFSQLARAKVTGPPGSGNFPAAEASGVNSVKFMVGAPTILNTMIAAAGSYDGVCWQFDAEFWKTWVDEAPECTWVSPYSDNNLVATTQFELPMVDKPTGIYDIYFRAQSSLKKKITIFWDPTVGCSGLNLSFQYGDLNRDNYVSTEEVALVQSHIGYSMSNLTNWLWEENVAYRAMDADFDCDGTITTTDYNLAASNVGQIGD